MEPFIYILGKEIPIYGVAWILGTALAGIIAYLLTKRSGMSKQQLKQQAKNIVYEIGDVKGTGR